MDYRKENKMMKEQAGVLLGLLLCMGLMLIGRLRLLHAGMITDRKEVDGLAGHDENY